MALLCWCWRRCPAASMGGTRARGPLGSLAEASFVRCGSAEAAQIQMIGGGECLDGVDWRRWSPGSGAAVASSPMYYRLLPPNCNSAVYCGRVSSFSGRRQQLGCARLLAAFALLTSAYFYGTSMGSSIQSQDPFSLLCHVMDLAPQHFAISCLSSWRTHSTNSAGLNLLHRDMNK
ncbi:hypothetical protein THAOC_02228 [Thalassiosira oceanica]|uniref:Uncharacterized protein n=1 Tax=Thalassiosira oceanica TaxID=159749 RepID=K0TG53_THAOC|nr:hypothetical protein THAOC_02228 [Thalassiosira oceanica]|eukprot:EJK76029.1 hypothetical protein THAOC_02228 [Thalassiosira oceanica]